MITRCLRPALGVSLFCLVATAAPTLAYPSVVIGGRVGMAIPISHALARTPVPARASGHLKVSQPTLSFTVPAGNQQPVSLPEVVTNTTSAAVKVTLRTSGVTGVGDSWLSVKPNMVTIAARHAVTLTVTAFTSLGVLLPGTYTGAVVLLAPRSHVQRVPVRMVATPVEEPGAWGSVAAMPTPRWSVATAVGTDGLIYAAGGWNSVTSCLGTMEAIDPTADNWSTLTPMPTCLNQLRLATSTDGRLFAIGETTVPTSPISLNSVVAYSPTTNTWMTEQPMPVSLFPNAVVAGKDGRIYAFGVPNDSTNTMTEIYSPSTNTWTFGALGAFSTGSSAAVGSDGRIYLLGHVLGELTLMIYSPSSNTWATGAAPLDAVYSNMWTNHAATGGDGRVYFFGACCTHPEDANAVEVYTPATNTWAQATPDPFGQRRASPVSAPDGRIYLVGGCCDIDGNAMSQVLAYIPAQSTWSYGASPPATCIPSSIAAAGDGNVYGVASNGCFMRYSIVGGQWSALPWLNPGPWQLAAGQDGRLYALACGQTSCLMEAYSPGANRWSLVPSPPEPVQQAVFLGGPGGRLYLIGGSIGGGPVGNTLQVFSVVTGSWTVGAAMPTARSLAAGAVGMDARVYVLGGMDNQGAPLTTAEAYSPVTNTWSSLAPMPSPEENLAAVAGPDGNVYVLGGQPRAVNESDQEMNAYSLATRTWRILPILPYELRGASPTVGPDMRIYLAGGQGYLFTNPDLLMY